MNVFRKAFEIINETWAKAPKLLRYDRFLTESRATSHIQNICKYRELQTDIWELSQMSTLQIQSYSSVRDPFLRSMPGRDLQTQVRLLCLVFGLRERSWEAVVATALCGREGDALQRRSHKYPTVPKTKLN
jgi:hypothetical protein